MDASAHGANALARPSVGMVLLSMRTCGVPTRLRICWPSMALRPWHTLEASSTIEGQAKQATLVVMYLGRLTLEANQHVGADGQKHADALKLYACVDRTRRLTKEVEQDSADAKGEFRKGDAGSSHHRQARPPDKASGTIRRISAGGQW